MEIDTKELTIFINKSLKNCYLGEMNRAKEIERQGFFEMEYTEDNWNYRDSFVGFYQSAGQEIVRFQNKPIWYRNYGGGVESEYIEDKEMFTKVEDFLRKALAHEFNQKAFRPRGPELFEEDNLKYECRWNGDVKSYIAEEWIYLNNEMVFTHKVFGGLIVGR